MAAFSNESDGRKYFEEINAVLSSELVNEVDVVIRAKPTKDCCPYIFERNMLAIMSWCIKDLFCFAYKTLFSLTRIKEGIYNYHAMELSRIILLIRAEDYTVWNLRKQYVVASKCYGDRELDFCTLVLTKHPRSSESFAHRRWLVKHLSRENDGRPNSATFLADELLLCTKCAERYGDNYTAWSHRCWLVDTFLKNDKQGLLEELRDNEAWLWLHVSDYCGFHFRQHLLEKLGRICCRNTTEDLYLKEAGAMDEMIRRYPGHETAWYHRRFLLTTSFSMFSPCQSCLHDWKNDINTTETESEVNEPHDSFDNGNACMRSGDKLQHACRYCTVSGKTRPLVKLPSPKSEMNFCCQFLHVPHDNASPQLKRQSTLSSSHMQWLKHFLQWKRSSTKLK